MKQLFFRPLSITGIILLLSTQGATAAQVQPQAAKTRQMLEQQQRKIDQLEQKLDAVMALYEENSSTGESTSSGSQSTTQIGGYGELHYRNLDTSNGSGRDKEINFKRLVLLLSHQFNKRLRLSSELEVENVVASSNPGDQGEVEVEQAYLEYDLNADHHVRGGLLLVPAGILNETHEPPTFYGVQRNPVESYIIPTTWSVNGIGLSGELAPGLSYTLDLHEGIKTTSNNNYAIRGGRQQGMKADAHDLASTGRLKWTALPGVELAATVQYQQDVTQGEDPNVGQAWLFESHAVINRGPLGLRALYARWMLSGRGPGNIGADRQEGFYIEPSLKVTPHVGLFSRYSRWDNQAGNGRRSQSENTQYNIGMNWWPHQDVVVKADYQGQENDDHTTEQDGLNLGIGYQF